MKVTKRYLRRIIRETLLFEQDDGISNADFAKELKSGAGAIASSVPSKLNDELAAVIQAMTAMAQFDRSKFDKMVGYANDLGAAALEKAEKGDKAEKEDIKEEIARLVREELDPRMYDYEPSHEEAERYLRDRADHYVRQNLGGQEIKLLLQDDFMDDLGDVHDFADFKKLIDELVLGRL